MIDIKSVMNEARKELSQESTEKAKKLIKDKLRQLENAKLIVLNIERELEDLEAKIAEGNY